MLYLLHPSPDNPGPIQLKRYKRYNGPGIRRWISFTFWSVTPHPLMDEHYVWRGRKGKRNVKDIQFLFLWMGCSTTKYYLKIKKLYVVEQRPKEKKLTSVLLHNH